MSIKSQREKMGITQKRLSEISGVNFQMIKLYECGSKDINGAKLLTILKICDALQCEIEDVITDTETLAYLRNLKRRKSIRYNLFENTREIPWNKRHEIKEGCTVDTYEYSPDLIKSFDNKADALKELKNYKTSVQELTYNGTVYRVTEYYVQEDEYDEYGEWCSGGNIWGFSKFDEWSKKYLKK